MQLTLGLELFNVLLYLGQLFFELLRIGLERFQLLSGRKEPPESRSATAPATAAGATNHTDVPGSTLAAS